jgi:hypothetical protein
MMRNNFGDLKLGFFLNFDQRNVLCSDRHSKIIVWINFRNIFCVCKFLIDNCGWDKGDLKLFIRKRVVFCFQSQKLNIAECGDLSQLNSIFMIQLGPLAVSRRAWVKNLINISCFWSSYLIYTEANDFFDGYFVGFSIVIPLVLNTDIL